ncbi:MAG TPA: response regulator [Blastocatellia bacterium]|nr:response regulator [Blastocatellia bacterium]
MRILYVEEHTESCELLTLWLGGSGYEVVPANTISEGLNLARSGAFDAYLLSSWFADGTGPELCQAIRVFDSSTPIIFYSALTRDRDQEAAMSAGAQAYLIKPDDLEKIEPTIKHLIGSGHAKCSSP